MEIPRFDFETANPEAVVAAVREAGCAVIAGVLDAVTLGQLRRELGPHLDRVPRGTGSFTGKRTRRTARLIAKSVVVRSLITQPLVQQAVTELFRGECYHHQLAMTQAVRIEPGESAQSLHRDDTTFPFKHPCPPSFINTIWALSDFTAENGATRAVLGSHRWGDSRKPTEAETLPVEMAAGSVLVFDGALYHGGGENRSAGVRDAILLGYSLGWLRAEEPQFLAVPRELARTLPRELLDLMGYRTHGYLGWYEGQHPSVTLDDELPELLPAADLFTPELERLEVRKR